MSDDDKKVKEGFDALGNFFSQFGPLDVYSRVLWEELLKELLDKNSSREGNTNGNQHN